MRVKYLALLAVLMAAVVAAIFLTPRHERDEPGAFKLRVTSHPETAIRMAAPGKIWVEGTVEAPTSYWIQVQAEGRAPVTAPITRNGSWGLDVRVTASGPLTVRLLNKEAQPVGRITLRVTVAGSEPTKSLAQGETPAATTSPTSQSVAPSSAVATPAEATPPPGLLPPPPEPTIGGRPASRLSLYNPGPGETLVIGDDVAITGRVPPGLRRIHIKVRRLEPTPVVVHEENPTLTEGREFSVRLSSTALGPGRYETLVVAKDGQQTKGQTFSREFSLEYSLAPRTRQWLGQHPGWVWAWFAVGLLAVLRLWRGIRWDAPTKTELVFGLVTIIGGFGSGAYVLASWLVQLARDLAHRIQVRRIGVYSPGHGVWAAPIHGAADADDEEYVVRSRPERPVLLPTSVAITEVGPPIGGSLRVHGTAVGSQTVEVFLWKGLNSHFDSRTEEVHHLLGTWSTTFRDVPPGRWNVTARTKGKEGEWVVARGSITILQPSPPAAPGGTAAPAAPPAAPNPGRAPVAEDKLLDLLAGGRKAAAPPQATTLAAPSGTAAQAASTTPPAPTPSLEITSAEWNDGQKKLVVKGRFDNLPNRSIIRVVLARPGETTRRGAGVGISGWETSFPDLRPGVYWLQAQAEDRQGSVIIGSKRLDVTIPAPTPEVLSPVPPVAAPPTTPAAAQAVTGNQGVIALGFLAAQWLPRGEQDFGALLGSVTLRYRAFPIDPNFKAGLTPPWVAVVLEMGTTGDIVVLMRKRDAAVLVDVTIGGDGRVPSLDFSELHLQVVEEFFSTMVGPLLDPVGEASGQPLPLGVKDRRMDNVAPVVPNEGVALEVTLNTELLVDAVFYIAFDQEAAAMIAAAMTPPPAPEPEGAAPEALPVPADPVLSLEGPLSLEEEALEDIPVAVPPPEEPPPGLTKAERKRKARAALRRAIAETPPEGAEPPQGE